MGDAVFGNPITNSTLGLPDFLDKKNIQRIDRARMTLNMKNAEEKNAKALQYLEKLKEQSEVGLGTLCLLYNATGDAISYVTHKNWHGRIGASPYPMQIANGQWAAFMHVSKPVHSIGAVVYRGKDPQGVDCDWMVSWDNPNDKNKWNTQAYSEIREKNHFSNCDWQVVYDKMQVSGVYHDGVEDKNNWDRCFLSACIGNHKFPIFVAVFTLQDV
ncbi:hypothetical protein FEM48_Zijuj03G0038900 [Ziziphus jujuba var. spinosa]|uniref:23 kDa jasmonate-induced protein-like n=1 Tax=Ziziphus jujuba var. spinosa TaxID=714518 RepID=A0A978VN09_ZIZJJ|nr:23 kDa jasmonate-induced protein-like [Ziziphus jujuba var. spinosa]KAH7536934.1 hypothetical protein FEM48_Zijuj03G0038900 [Ziziphus jujuba var. spinosa]